MKNKNKAESMAILTKALDDAKEMMAKEIKAKFNKDLPPLQNARADRNKSLHPGLQGGLEESGQAHPKLRCPRWLGHSGKLKAAARGNRRNSESVHPDRL